MDHLRDDLLQNHGQINVVDFDFYDTSIFNRCESGNDVLIAIPGWDMVHPLLKVIPVQWEYTIPYGLLYAPKPSETVKHFLEAARTAIQDTES